MVRSGCYGGFWGVFKAASILFGGEGAVTLLQNQLSQTIESTTKEFALPLIEVVRRNRTFSKVVDG